MFEVGAYRSDPILFTDEDSFTRDGINNTHNSHWWSNKNPHAIAEINSRNRFSVNVWCDAFDRQLIGPAVLPTRLTGRAYVDFLPNELPLLLEEVPSAKRMCMVFQHDGAPAYYPLSYGVPVRERYCSTLLPAIREQHDQNCTQSH